MQSYVESNNDAMSKNQTNILYILNDHQAYYGHSQVKRPVFDKLAGEGILFENAYTACPLCGPARRSMLTGLYPHNHGEYQNDDNHPYDKDLYLDIMAGSNYEQYYFGKWHAGTGDALEHNCTGFNYPSYNNPYTKPEYKAYLKELNLPEPEVFVEHNFWDYPNMAGKIIKQDGDWCNEHASGMMVTPKETHESFFLAYLAKKKLKELSEIKGSGPFSMRVDFWGPHQPYFPTREFAAMYNPNDINLPESLRENVYTNNKPEIYQVEHNKGLHEDGRLIYPSALEDSQWRQILARCYAQITQVDAAAGIILDALREYGFEENTLVILSTDHGDAVACHGGHFDKASYMPDELIHIPMAIRCPGVIPSGQTSKHFVSNMDIGATILDAADLKYPNPVNGRSILEINKDSSVPWRDFIVCETHGHWGNHIGRALITDKYKFIFNENQINELYDRKAAPSELNNLAVKEDFQDICCQMLNWLKEWASETNDFKLLALLAEYQK